MKKYLLIILTASLFSCTEKSLFELVESKHTGIRFVNKIIDTDSLHVMNFEYIYNGAGVGIEDLNNDGRPDIVFTGNQESPGVYLNEGNFKFSDITSSFEDLDKGQWYSGVTFVDINNDGWNDVYLTCTAHDDSERRKNRFYINQGIQSDGSLVFQDMAESYGIADDSYTVTAAFFDYDRDGDLDLFLLNNYTNDRLSASYRPKITDGSAPNNDDLYRNNGDGTFSNVSRESGIVYEGFSLGLALGDVNRDGYTDIYVSNDYISNDLLYINQGDGTFQNRIDAYLSYQSKSSMGNDLADINNDGFPEIFTLDMMPEYYHLKKQTIGGFGYIYYISDAKYGYEHQYLRNMLHLHNGRIDGEMIPYSEVGQMMGIYQTEWSWSPLFADYDNDGDKDLIVTNGYPRDMTDKDWTNYKSEVVGAEADPQNVISKMPAVKVVNCAFENKGDLKFVKRSFEWFGETTSFSYGAAFADLDGDGDLDYVVNNLNDEAFIYKNNTIEKGSEQGNFLRIILKGEGANSSAIGAKVELWCKGNYQYQEHFSSRGYASSVDPVIHFGLSDHMMVDSLKVTWPASSYVSSLKNVQSNQLIEIDESTADPSMPDAFRQEDTRYLFSSVEGVLDYDHQQEDIIDFHLTQSIIPHKFSQIGPCMHKGDINNDGKEDILIGATNTLPTTVFLRKGNGFVETSFEGLTHHKECPESDFAIIDVDLDGDNDVIALAGGYENPEEEFIHYLYENINGSFSRTALPTSPFPASVVKPVDFDHDGDLDLFIGARIGLEIFPFAANSWFLINDQGRYKPENTLNFYLGMVTDATWSDYDGDGYEDLFVAREWNSLAVLKNLKGERIQFQKFPEIESKHGIWYSIASADFDLDGDQDFIVGNLGDNHRFTVSDQYPMRIYALDMDLNGTLDPISSAYWKDPNDVMKEFPIHYFDELMGQSPYFVGNVDDYTSFSYITINEILDSSMMNRVDYILQANTSSSYIIWNNNDSFQWEKLPDLAQVSPIKQILIQDFNRDNYPDVILAGNDHTYDVSTGYYDANKGLLLLSKDNRPLSDLLTPSETGFMLHGMIESLLYMEGESPLIVAGLNRDKARVFSVTHSK
ncbi:MAG: VCBS repeat-containing protein [Bacteroidota bacterium]|nr:VCBS repeat-containing protein [Bacteroidota bacterium]